MSIKTQALIGGLKKYPLLVISALVALVLLGTLYSRSGLIEAQQEELDKYLAESSRHRANIANAAQLQDQLNFLIQANKAVKDRALTAEGLAQNLQYFYRLEADVGIKYLDLRPGSKYTGKSSIYVPLNHIVNVQGSFTQIITFLRRLEQGVYFCRINTASASSNGDVVTLNLNLDLLGVP
jgi:Tfp pilus assembly protein PilO